MAAADLAGRPAGAWPDRAHRTVGPSSFGRLLPAFRFKSACRGMLELRSDVGTPAPVLDLPDLPGLCDYLESLDAGERAPRSRRMSTMADAVCAASGSTSRSTPRHDYRARDIEASYPVRLCGTLCRNGRDAGRTTRTTAAPSLRRRRDDLRLHHQARAVHYRNRYVRTSITAASRAPGTWAPMRPAGSCQHRLAADQPGQHQRRRACRSTVRAGGGGPPCRRHPGDQGLRRFGGELRWIGSYSRTRVSVPSLAGTCSASASSSCRHRTCGCTAPTARASLKHYRSVALPYVAMVHDSPSPSAIWVFLVSPIIPRRHTDRALGLKAFGDAMKYHPERGSTFLLIPRDGGEDPPYRP